MEYFQTMKINEHTYQIKEKLGVLSTLIIGKTKALLIDTGYGIFNLKQYIKQYTNLPLIVIASHGHMDHTGGNYLFDEVYINNLDIELCKQHNNKDRREKNLIAAESLNALTNDYDKESYINQNEGNLIPLKNDMTFDLGGITCKVIPMEGHTKGSVGIYVKEDNTLVTTDATCPFVWMFLNESTTVSEYINMLNRTLQIPFENILLGHGKGELVPRSRVYEFLNVAQSIDLNKSIKVTFTNFEELNSYCYTEGKMYDQNDCGIVFDPNKL